MGESQEAVENALTGQNPHTFRVAQAQLDSNSVPSVRVDRISERPLEELVSLEPTYLQHEAVTGIPFTASYYSLDKVYKELEPKDQKFIRTIDDHIAKQIKSGKFTDSAEAATQIIKDLENKLKLTDNNDPYYRAERISNYLKSVGDYNKQATLKARLTKETKQSETEAITKSAISSVKKVSQSAIEQVSQLKQELVKKEIKTTNQIKKEVASVASEEISQLRKEIVGKESVLGSELIKQKDQQISKLLEVNERLVQDQLSLKDNLNKEREQLSIRELEFEREKMRLLKEQGDAYSKNQQKIKMALAKLAQGF